MKWINCICIRTCCVMAVTKGYIQSKELSALFHMHELTGAQEWLISLWLTREYEPPIESAQAVLLTWLPAMDECQDLDWWSPDDREDNVLLLHSWAMLVFNVIYMLCYNHKWYNFILSKCTILIIYSTQTLTPKKVDFIPVKQLESPTVNNVE